jgi:formate dehydrogenase major subunit
LSWFLRQRGFEVTIYEAQPAAGGMLRYGVPAYRLPRAAVEADVARIVAAGVHIEYNTRVGTDISLDDLRARYSAVALGIGAWRSTGTGAEQPGGPGVIGALELLRSVADGNPPVLGTRVAVIGGGNVAMDACRTLVRLGASEVHCVYRRTRAEMPADLDEIEDALAEGVIFDYLRSPLSYDTNANGELECITLQVNEPGTPDPSGRRQPVAVSGATQALPIDTVVLACGQATDTSGLEELSLAPGRCTAFAYDPQTCLTSAPGVFAGGDCGNSGVPIAVEAIASAQRCAQAITAWLKGERPTYDPPAVVERDAVCESAFEDHPRQGRPPVRRLSVAQRCADFREVEPDWPQDLVCQEARRCLGQECVRES